MSTVRKVQRTPGGTFFVCVPKSWAQRYNLKPGGLVSVAETSEGKLLIDAQYGVSPTPMTATLMTGPSLSREIIGNYLLGYDVVRVESKGGISPEARQIVKSAVDHLIGLEIVEEDYSTIVLQCLLEPSGFPPEKFLRRGYSIAASMHRDAVNAFLDGDVALAKNVIARDDEGNRLYFLVVRILRTIVQNPSLSQKLGISPIDCLDYRLVASLVEGIGDECVRVASKVIEIRGAKLKTDLKRRFLDFHTLCFQSHEDALNAFLKGDVKIAEDVRKACDKIDAAFKSIERDAREQTLELVPQVLAIAAFLRQIYEHSVDVADLVVPRRSA